MKSFTVIAVIGPKMCGKTENKDALKKYFKAKRIIDEDEFRGFSHLRRGDLILTTRRFSQRGVQGNKPLSASIKYVDWEVILITVPNLKRGAARWYKTLKNEAP